MQSAFISFEWRTVWIDIYCAIQLSKIKHFPAIHDKYHLLFHLLITLIAYIANNMDPDQTAP